MKPVIDYNAFTCKIAKVEFAVSKSGIEYISIHCDGNMCIGTRKSTNNLFKINLVKLYQAYVECEVINTTTLKPYVDRVQSPSYAILIAAELI